MTRKYGTGTLIEYRNRPWVVQQSTDNDVIVLKPLGGTDDETMGLYLPLYGDDFNLNSYSFKKPSSEDIGILGYKQSALMLYDACRLSFRDIAGPFQCLGKLSFEPRPYQMVPLILALHQQPEKIRLLISDDVGIGKTLESLLIAKELLDRHEINRFAVICLPHLCEQWQNEIKDKFGLDAEIIRSSTVGRLEKKLRGDQQIFRDIPYQVISIDYVKQPGRVKTFLDHCPDFIIVDEAHTCTKPKGANNSQQQRYHLVHELSKAGKQLVLLTATPHSGQEEEFQSLIGLLDPKFENYTLSTAKEREELSHYFIQRRRVDIQKYLGKDVVFPKRLQIDNGNYKIDNQYRMLLNDLINYIKRGVQAVRGEDKRKQRYIYWDLLALMRGVMSSPDAGISMLENKTAKKEDEDTEVENAEDANTDAQETYIFNDNLKDLLNGDDNLPSAMEKADRGEKDQLKKFISELRDIKENDKDTKVKMALDTVVFTLDNNANPIVFCQYIQTAEYVGEYISQHLAKTKRYKDVAVDIVTSRLADEERKMKIDALCAKNRHVLVCTDCLSEGVNLQEGFEAIIHYDLPWNPNRLEQRNGRIDRFGQTSSEVIISSLYAENNPVDDIVLNVLYKKQNEIRKRLGVYLPIADNDASLMESIMKKIIATNTNQSEFMQPSLFKDDDFKETDDKEREIRLKSVEAAQKLSHTYFAHNTKLLDPSRLIASLNEAKNVIGGVQDTCDFVIGKLRNIGVPVKENKPLCYQFPLANLPDSFKSYFKETNSIVRISFLSPTPKGYMYIGRNHVFVEDLSRGVINDTVNGGNLAESRAMVTETNVVKKRTTVMMMRVRSVIRNKKQTDNELVGEEMIFFGYRGKIEDKDLISQEECKSLLLNSRPSGDIGITEQRIIYDRALEWIKDERTLRLYTDDIANERATHLVNAFTQYRTYQPGTAEYQVVEPVLPMDVIAAYVFVPQMPKF